MQIGKFIVGKSLRLNKKDIVIYTKLLKETELTHCEDDSGLINSTMYVEYINGVEFKSVGNHWSTGYKNREFTATAKKFMLFIHKNKGKKGTEYENTIQYSANLSIYGDFRYKYERGTRDNEGIYCNYDYDTNLSDLLKRTIKYYNEKKPKLTNNNLKSN